MSEETNLDDVTAHQSHLVITKRIMAALAVAGVFFVGLTSFAVGRVTAERNSDPAEYPELMSERRGPGMERRGPGMERRGPGMERRGPGMERRGPGMEPMPEGQSGISNG